MRAILIACVLTLLLSVPVQAGTDRYCIAVWTDPPMPETITALGFVTDIYVSAAKPNGYTLSDGTTYLWSATHPLKGARFYPNREYRITVDGPVVFTHGTQIGCSMGPFTEAPLYRMYIMGVMR